MMETFQAEHYDNLPFGIPMTCWIWDGNMTKIKCCHQVFVEKWSASWKCHSNENRNDAIAIYALSLSADAAAAILVVVVVAVHVDMVNNANQANRNKNDFLTWSTCQVASIYYTIFCNTSHFISNDISSYYCNKQQFILVTYLHQNGKSLCFVICDCINVRYAYYARTNVQVLYYIYGK